MNPIQNTPERVIDVHAHFVPQAYRNALVAAGHSHPDGSPIPAWSVTSHIEQLDRLGISTAMLSASSPGTEVDGRSEYWARFLNESGATIRAEHPDRFGWLASLPLPDVDAALREIEYCDTALKPDGFALLTNQQGVYLGDARLEPVMEQLDKRDAVVFMHPTSPGGCGHVDMGRPAPLIEYVFDTTRAVVNLVLSGTLARYPDIRWIVPHNGAALASVIDRVQLFQHYILNAPAEREIERALRGLYYEVGSSAPFPRTGSAARTLADSDQFLLGTDLPYAPPPAVGDNMQRILSGQLLTGEQLDQLTHLNAQRLFPRLNAMN